jgi:hypothetical protein
VAAWPGGSAKALPHPRRRGLNAWVETYAYRQTVAPPPSVAGSCRVEWRGAKRLKNGLKFCRVRSFLTPLSGCRYWGRFSPGYRGAQPRANFFRPFRTRWRRGREEARKCVAPPATSRDQRRHRAASTRRAILGLNAWVEPHAYLQTVAPRLRLAGSCRVGVGMLVGWRDARSAC